MAAPSPNKSRGWIIALIVVVVLIGLYLLLHNMHQAITVRTATVEYHDVISKISTNGKVEPTNDFQAHADAPSIVTRLYVSLGQQVQKGQQLIELDPTDAASKVASARAQLAASELALANMQHGGSAAQILTQNADLANAQQEQKTAAAQLRTLKALQAEGAASADEVSQAQARLAADTARVSQIEAQRTGSYSRGDLAAQQSLNQANQAAVVAAESGYAGVDIRAPFAGTIYSLPVAQYDYVQAGEALLSLADLHQLRVRAYFDEPDIGKLVAGQPVQIVWDARPDQVWHGHILQAPTTVITYGTRNVGESLITVDDAQGDLLPNTNVTVTVTTSERFHVLSLPREALRTEGATDFVYRVVDGKLVRTPVQVGLVNLTRVEITGGLSEGDVVALGATTETELTNGLHVKSQPQQ